MRGEASTREPQGTRSRTLDPQEVLKAAKHRLLAYCSLTNEDYAKPKHLKAIAGILERVEKGELRRVIITIPPRHGKSMLCSQYFPAWYMGRNPSKYLITATYGQELSDDFGRKVRDQIEDPLFNTLFPECRLRSDSRAASKFETIHGGTYVSVGVGGSIMGRGAHLLFIDDAIKDREQADSELIRKKIWDWYISTAYTRLMPGGAVVVIMTRWHEEDLVGHLLKQAHENWHVVNLKAIDDEGRALWPEAYNLETLLNIKKGAEEAGQEYNWHCLYQQNPLPKEGMLFRPEWLQPGASDEYAMTLMGIDPAISEQDEADETAIVAVGLDYSNPFQITELRSEHGHYDVHEQVNRIVKMFHTIKPTPFIVGVETNAYQAALGQILMRKGLPVMELRSIKDKRLRANEVLHFFAQGRVKINTIALREQLLRFRGKGERNDMVDALVHALRVVQATASDQMDKKIDRYNGLSPEQVLRKKSFERELENYGAGLTESPAHFNEIEF